MFVINNILMKKQNITESDVMRDYYLTYEPLKDII